MNGDILIVYAILAGAAIFIPVSLSVARKKGLNRKRLLMLLAVGSLISGMMTLVATAPNLVVAQALAAVDLEPLGFFSFTPFAIDAAITVNAPPHAFAMTVAIACSAAYVTPVSSPVNMMVLEPGGYAFMDFVKVGLPLLFLSLVATVVLVGAIYMH